MAEGYWLAQSRAGREPWEGREPWAWREPWSSRDVRDVFGRAYRAGPSDRALLGHSRALVAAAAWGAMLAVSCTQYGYGALAARAGWTPQAAAWGFAAWVCCQSVASTALPWLRHTLRLTPPKTVTAGAAACAGGLLALGWAADPAALAIYAVAAGIGAGLVYGTCVAIVSAWYPDRPTRIAMVSGAFGYGAVPVIAVVAGARGSHPAFGALAWAVLLVAVTCAPILREPPERWWPAALDPRRWAIDKRINPALRLHPPAAREHSPAEVLHSGQAWILAGIAFGTWGVALFDTGWLYPFGIGSGWGVRGAALGLGAFAAGSGGIRAVAALAADRIGRARVIVAGAGGGAAAQLLLAVAVAHRDLPLFWLAAAGAGAAAGTGYALLPGLVRGSFGDRPGLPNLWVIYPAKAAGAVAGAVGAGWLSVAAGVPPALIASAALALGTCVLVPRLRRPGLPKTLPDIAATDGGVT
jgi:MFS family permease